MRDVRGEEGGSERFASAGASGGRLYQGEVEMCGRAGTCVGRLLSSVRLCLSVSLALSRSRARSLSLKSSTVLPYCNFQEHLRQYRHSMVALGCATLRQLPL